MKFFAVTHRSARSRARAGIISTAHGDIKTPAFVPVATKGTLKGIFPGFLKEIGVQVAFVNTYHLAVSPGIRVIKSAGGIRALSQLAIPLMSDSGGFQVFSLAKNGKRKAKMRGGEEALVLKISEEGVLFRALESGEKVLFTPEKSMEYQAAIGADIVMAFDECTFYPSEYSYAKKSSERTHDWLRRSVGAFGKIHRNNLDSQFLYGIIQGGEYEDLRKASAGFVLSQGVDGVAIGGVSVGESKDTMRKEIAWIRGYLPEDRPVHLLGIGQIDDIIETVRHGIDTFDCVEPTRYAREGKLSLLPDADLRKIVGGKFSNKNLWIDISSQKYRADLSPPSQKCDCMVCAKFTRAYLHHLFRQKELLAYSLATHHNLFSMEKFFAFMRGAILRDEI